MDITLILIWVVIGLAWFIYEKFSRNLREFEGYGIKYVKPWQGLGNFYKIMTSQITIHGIIDKIYKEYSDQKVIPALSVTNQRVFVLRDPALIKRITIKDFDAFVNHDKTIDDSLDPVIGKSLFVLRDDKWRTMRNSLSPMFTSSRMKMMFGILAEAADDFVAFCDEKLAADGRVVLDAKKTFVRYSADGISTAVLGFKGDCVRNENSEIFAMAQRLIRPEPSALYKGLLFMLAKWLYKALKLRVLPPDLYSFFHDAIVKVMWEREAQGIYRPDVIELLLRAKRGQLSETSGDVNEAELRNFAANPEYEVSAKAPIAWTDDHYIAQGHLFFAAGLATSAVLLETAVYYLAVNRDYQQLIIDEVDAVRAPTYEAIHKLNFLDMFISEVLRLWAAPILMRECSRDYRMDIGDGVVLTLRPGDIVQLPVWSIHRDERLFERAGEFDPYRFSDERKGSIVSGSYMPFGSGPRICIASRFALMEAKVLLYKILSKYTVEACDKTPKQLEVKANLMEFCFTEDIVVELKPRGH